MACVLLHPAPMRALALCAVVASAASCAGVLTPGGDPVADPAGGTPAPLDPTGGGDPGPGNGGGNGGPTCPNGTHLDGMLCVADEVTCAAEFPCPDGEQCVGGRCVILPGPCATNDDCPAGDACVNGTCAPVCPDGNGACKADSDCGAGEVCVACTCVPLGQCQTPTADLSGNPWSANQDLHLDEALGAFGQTFAGIVKQLRDGILGCPPGSSGDCFLFAIIAGFIPDYGQTLIVAVGNFVDVIDNHDFLVQSQMTYMKNGKPSGYSGVDHWTLLTFNYQNHQVSEKPENVPQIGQPVFVPFQASAVCGVLYVDKHKVEGVLSGILKWIIDTVVEIETCKNGGPCYHSLSDAIDGAIDCSQIGNFAAMLACEGFKAGLASQIQQALDSWLLSYSLMTLKGTALVDGPGKTLSKGHWDGTLGDGIGIFKNFNGEWSAKR